MLEYYHLILLSNAYCNSNVIIVSTHSSFPSFTILPQPTLTPIASARVQLAMLLPNNKPIGTINTQEAFCINQLLNKEPAWYPWDVAQTGFIFGGILGGLFYMSIGATGNIVRKQYAQISRELLQEGRKSNNNALKQLGHYVRWLHKQTPYLNQAPEEIQTPWKMLGLLALKGGVSGGLLGLSLTTGSIAEIKHGLRRQQADTEGNQNWLKSATWQNRVEQAVKTQTLEPLVHLQAQPTNDTTIQHQQLEYRKWRTKTFSKSYHFRLLLAIGLLYSAGTMGLSALGSKLLLNQFTAKNINWVQLFNKVEQTLKHLVHLGEKNNWLKGLKPVINCIPGVQNGKFTGMQIVEKINADFSRWLTLTFNKATAKSSQTEDLNSQVLRFLEESQGKFFHNLVVNRYHPVALLQLTLTASLLSACLSVRNKWIIKKTEQTVEKQHPELAGQLALLRLEEARRIKHAKQFKKQVAQQHFKPL